MAGRSIAAILAIGLALRGVLGCVAMMPQFASHAAQCCKTSCAQHTTSSPERCCNAASHVETAEVASFVTSTHAPTIVSPAISVVATARDLGLTTHNASFTARAAPPIAMLSVLCSRQI